ncbi:Glycoside hydrolase family 5 protein [Mycena kentingensis (nom. inval.)]|nr:Glycoside hydrolase family 5 protein [Mycena kentingensis (nom. inval.)]
MELRLVYRILRKISDWAVYSGYYSEVFVEGADVVPKDAPIILTPSHHNELVDIAALAATLPHRRMVSFWAKSTTFKKPVLGHALESVGAIPVKRNPNKADAAESNAALFDASTVTLGQNKALGVFPEGTSYTEPEIQQVLSGAGWAALEYMRSRGELKPVLIIPVGIVYTDKSRYRSRVHVEYGTPIDMAKYAPPALFEAGDEEAERAAVKAVMKEVEDQLRALTINAPDWETLYAARMTRDILWTNDENVKLKDWVVVGQTLVKLLSSADDGVKNALTKYFALLQRTGITHAQLAILAPNLSKLPSRLFVFRFIFTFLRTILNPSFLLFVPPMIAHLPAYLCASLANVLAPAGEEESRSQFKVFLGGFGTGIGAGATSYWATKLLTTRFLSESAGLEGKIALWSLTAWFLVKWHLLLVDSNYRRFKRLGAAFKILLGVLQPRSWELPASKAALYEKPPIPASNPFLKNSSPGASFGGKAWLKAQPPAVASRRMVFHLLRAREAAVDALGKYTEGQTRTEERLLLALGGSFPRKP